VAGKPLAGPIHQVGLMPGGADPMISAGLDDQVLGVAGGRVNPSGVFDRDHRVGFAVDHQNPADAGELVGEVEGEVRHPMGEVFGPGGPDDVLVNPDRSGHGYHRVGGYLTGRGEADRSAHAAAEEPEPVTDLGPGPEGFDGGQEIPAAAVQSGHPVKVALAAAPAPVVEPEISDAEGRDALGQSGLLGRVARGVKAVGPDHHRRRGGRVAGGQVENPFQTEAVGGKMNQSAGPVIGGIGRINGHWGSFRCSARTGTG